MSSSIFILFSVLAISAFATAQDLTEILLTLNDHDAGQEVADNVAQSEDCSPDAITRCLSPLMSLIGKDDEDDKQACEVVRATYNCLKNKADQCLDSPAARTDIQEDLDQMKNLLTSKCDLKVEADSLPCIMDQMKKVRECATDGIAKVVFSIDKKGENDFERFQCWAYLEMVDCFRMRVQKNCGVSAEKKLREMFVELPPQIKDSCAIAKPGQTLEELFDFDN